MGRHVDQVAGTWRQRRQLVGVLQRPVWMRRRLDSVDIEVYRPKVIGLSRQHRLERAKHFVGELARAAVERPVVPRRRVHQRLRKERGGIEVVGKSSGNRAHRVSGDPLDGGRVRSSVWGAA